MPVTYTNRKGVTYTLCRTTTKTGNTRYVFLRDPTGRETVAEIPEGWEIRESVNGVVSLAKALHQQHLLPEELTLVEAALEAHPKTHNYRLDVQPERLVIYGREGPAADALFEAFVAYSGIEIPSDVTQRLRGDLEPFGRFTPILRFTLTDAETRAYRAERWRFQDHIDNWIFVDSGDLVGLAERLIPTLGTDAFFELY